MKLGKGIKGWWLIGSFFSQALIDEKLNMIVTGIQRISTRISMPLEKRGAAAFF